MTESRVPTSPNNSPQRAGWSLETAIDYLLALINEKHDHNLSIFNEKHERLFILINEKDEHLRTLIAANDRRYEQRVDGVLKALELGLSVQKTEISAALAAADRAVTKAEVATEKRFDGVNEFRAALDNQQRTLIPRIEVDVLIRGVEEKIHNLTKLLDEVRTRRREVEGVSHGVGVGWGYAVGVVGFMLLIAAFLMRFY